MDTYGPNMINGSDPGGALSIPATAEICGGLLPMRGLKNLLGGRGVGVIGIWEEFGNKIRDSVKAVARAWCWRLTGIRLSLKRTWYFWFDFQPPNDSWNRRPTSLWWTKCTWPSYQCPCSAFCLRTRMRSPGRTQTVEEVCRSIWRTNQNTWPFLR